MTGPASALLGPRLGTATPGLCPGQRALSARPASGQLGSHDLVHHGDIRLDTKQSVVEIDGACFVAGLAADIDLRHHRPPFTASRMRTVAPRGPGTEPRTSSNSRSASACTTWRFSVVVFWLPIRPGRRLPLNTRDGVAH